MAEDNVLFNAITIKIASPQIIRSWSMGEVKKPETINYRTLKPEKDGLFCERIFGPTKDYECNCGKYKRIKHKGIVCDRCGVEVTRSSVRRERMGHIELACPVSHVWFFKVMPSRIGILIGLTSRELEKVIYYEEYIVTDPGETPLKKMELLSEDRFKEYKDKYGQKFTAKMGGEAIRELLKEIDLDKLAAKVKREIKDTKSDATQKKSTKIMRLIDALKLSGNRPEWMILDILPVIPPDLRPLVPLDGGRFATSDLNDLYRRVINRNNRLKKLIELNFMKDGERTLTFIKDAEGNVTGTTTVNSLAVAVQKEIDKLAKGDFPIRSVGGDEGVELTEDQKIFAIAAFKHGLFRKAVSLTDKQVVGWDDLEAETTINAVTSLWDTYKVTSKNAIRKNAYFSLEKGILNMPEDEDAEVEVLV